ncbi:MAG: cytochrome c biogenesis protein ResB [Cyanobacteria bacterium P01_F01_bin.53]
MIPKLSQFLGSIKLAVPLLVAIGLILIGATFYESEVGSTVVQQEIYKSPWFGALMFLLALNLGISTLSRYPWKGARKIGFAITHWGLVVIIAGSAAVIHLSVEGMLLARTDGGPVSTLRVEGDLVEVAMPGTTPEQASLFIKADGTVVPKQVGGLSLLKYSSNTVKTVHFEDGGSVDNPAVRLVLQSDRMGQILERWLAAAPVAYDSLDVGPAELQIVNARTDEAFQAALQASDEGTSTAKWGELTVNWLGKSRLIDVEAALNSAQLNVSRLSTSQQNVSQLSQPELNKPIELRAKGKTLTLAITGFWPDFRLDSDRLPTSASQQIRNPAIQLTLTEQNGNNISAESWFVFGNPNFEPIRNQILDEPIRNQISGKAINAKADYTIATETEPNAFFRVVVDARETDKTGAATGSKTALHYAAKSSKGFKSGPLSVGDAVTPGWADFRITLADYIPQAEVKREVVPLPEGAPEQGEAALLVAASISEPGSEPGSEPVWVPWGEPTTINSPEGDGFVAFSPKLLPLPFSLKLNDFIVERNEGSESVAMWTSALSLIDPHAGERVDRRVWMNHPTWFKGWKIAQASWNPGDLSQSTLQVKREPWWVTGLTWLGSLMVTIGVATMFYGRSIAKKFKKVSALAHTSDSTSDNTPNNNNSDIEEEITESVSIPLLNVFSGR